jgi:hypothetical protein
MISMKRNSTHWLALLAFAAFAVRALAVEIEEPREEDKHRLSLSGRFGFNINAKFKGNAVGGFTTPTGSGRRTPSDPNDPQGTRPYNYDNGYIYNDISGSADSLTWFWGYDNSSAQVNSSTLNPGGYNNAIPDNSILLTRTTTVGSTGGDQKLAGDEPYLGFEITYNRELGRRERRRWGIEAAFNHLNLCLGTRANSSATAVTVTDAYQYFPGTTPPNGTPANPYQQTYSGPITGTAGFVVSNIIAATFGSTNTASVVGNYKFRADVFGFRLGPYLDFPLGERTLLSLNAGVALGLVSSHASWSETVTVNSATTVASASGSSCGVMWGGYLGANLSYQINRRWSVTGGVQWQGLSSYSQTLGTKKVELDMENALFVTIGVSYSF